MRVLGKLVSVAACMGCLFAAMTAKAADDSLTVKTDTGKVHGKMSLEGQVRAFLGIPYAAPPVGPLRWKPPQPARKWTGVREATAFGAHCMQPNIYSDMIFRDPGPSEDCLTLNVWTAAKDKKARLPVMVWIYGGGFAAGATSEARQDGAHLATKGVVVVSMNYRLGIFGFLALPGLAAESAQHAAGDYGLIAVGAEKHCGVWGRSGQRDGVRRIGRIVLGERADGVAAGAGTVQARNRRERRGVSGPAWAGIQAAGRDGEAGRGVCHFGVRDQ
jgi:hypothetical protein